MSRCQTPETEVQTRYARMTASTSSRLASISSCERASRFSRSSGSVFDGRTFMCQSSASTDRPSRCETRPSGPKRSFSSWSFTATSATRVLISPVRKYRRAELREDLAQLLAARRDELEHQQERDHAGVGLREVAEVVVRRHLAAEDRALVAHPLLDERVPDAVHQRLAARRADRLGHRPRRAHVVDHLAARLLREDRLGEQRGREVARHELARVVDEEAAVGVAVVGHAEVGALLASSCATMNSRFSGSSGFGSWFGNEPSGSK